MFTLKKVVSISILLIGSCMGLLLYACHSTSPKPTPITVIPVSGRFSNDHSKEISPNPTITCDDATTVSGDPTVVTDKTTSISQTTPPESTAIMFIIDDTMSVENIPNVDQREFRERIIAYYLNILQRVAGQTASNSFGPLQLGVERFGSTYVGHRSEKQSLKYEYYQEPPFFLYSFYRPLELSPISELANQQRDWYSELKIDTFNFSGENHPEILYQTYQTLKDAINRTPKTPEPVKKKEIVLFTEGNFNEDSGDGLDRMYRILHQLASMDRETTVDVVLLRPINELSKQSKQIWSKEHYPKLINEVYFYEEKDLEKIVKNLFDDHLFKFLPADTNYHKYGWVGESPITIPGDTHSFSLNVITFAKPGDQTENTLKPPTFFINDSPDYQKPQKLTLEESGYIWNYDNTTQTPLIPNGFTDGPLCPEHELTITFPPSIGPAFYMVQPVSFDFHSEKMSILDMNGKNLPIDPVKKTIYLKVYGEVDPELEVTVTLKENTDEFQFYQYLNCYTPLLSLSPIQNNSSQVQIITKEKPDIEKVTRQKTRDLYWRINFHPSDETPISLKVDLKPASELTANNGEINLATQTVDLEILPKLNGKFSWTECSELPIPELCSDPENSDAEYIDAARISFSIDYIGALKEQPKFYIFPCPNDPKNKCTIDNWIKSEKNFYHIIPTISPDNKSYQYVIQHINESRNNKSVFDALSGSTIWIEWKKWYLFTDKITSKEQSLECVDNPGYIIYQDKRYICPTP